MDKALLDTDILSEILRARDQQVIAQVVVYKAQHGQLTTSTIIVIEIVKGFHSQNPDTPPDWERAWPSSFP